MGYSGRGKFAGEVWNDFHGKCTPLYLVQEPQLLRELNTSRIVGMPAALSTVYRVAGLSGYFKVRQIWVLCCCCLPCNYCSNWTWVVEEILAFFGTRLRSTHCRNSIIWNYADPLTSLELLNYFYNRKQWIGFVSFWFSIHHLLLVHLHSTVYSLQCILASA